MSEVRDVRTDLAVIEQGLSVRDQVQAALERLETATPAEAAAMAADAATLVELLRRRGLALEEINALAEMKIRAERKVGEARLNLRRSNKRIDWSKAKELLDSGLTVKAVARELGMEPASVRYARRQGFQRARKKIGGSWLPVVRTFDNELGLRSSQGEIWSKLASIPDEQLMQIMEEIASRGEEVTTNRIIYRARLAGYAGAEKVEKNIFRLPDGRFHIKYRASGREHSQTLQTTELAVARRILLERRGLLKNGRTSKARAARVDASYSDLRICLDRLDKVLSSLAPAARAAAEEAIGHGHRMEDALARCLKETR